VCFNESGWIEHKTVILANDIKPKQKNINKLIEMVMIFTNNTQIFHLIDFSHYYFIGALNHGLSFIIFYLFFQFSDNIGYLLFEHRLYFMIETLLHKCASFIIIESLAFFIFDPTYRRSKIQSQIFLIVCMNKLENICDIFFIACLLIFDLGWYCCWILALRFW